MPHRARLAEYAAAIIRLPDGVLTEADLLQEQFHLYREGRVDVYYAPFEDVCTTARVVLVGVYPGPTQMRLAFAEARDALRSGCDAQEAARRVRAAASFGGALRHNLVAMLDDIELPAALGLVSSAELFEPGNEAVHLTAAVRHAVFVKGAPYSGHAPKLMREPLLARYVHERLGPELAAMPAALVVPLGHVAASAVASLVQRGQLDALRVLAGFPHPSGGNGHRVREFATARGALTEQVDAWFERTGRGVAPHARRATPAEVPTSRPRYTVTDTGPVAEMLDLAHRRWPDVDDRRALLLRLAAVGRDAIAEDVGNSERVQQRRRQEEALARAGRLVDGDALLGDVAWR